MTDLASKMKNIKKLLEKQNHSKQNFLPLSDLAQSLDYSSRKIKSNRDSPFNEKININNQQHHRTKAVVHNNLFNSLSQNIKKYYTINLDDIKNKKDKYNFINENNINEEKNHKQLKRLIIEDIENSNEKSDFLKLNFGQKYFFSKFNNNPNFIQDNNNNNFPLHNSADNICKNLSNKKINSNLLEKNLNMNSIIEEEINDEKNNNKKTFNIKNFQNATFSSEKKIDLKEQKTLSTFFDSSDKKTKNNNDYNKEDDYLLKTTIKLKEKTKKLKIRLDDSNKKNKELEINLENLKKQFETLKKQILVDRDFFIKITKFLVKINKDNIKIGVMNSNESKQIWKKMKDEIETIV